MIPPLGVNISNDPGQAAADCAAAAKLAAKWVRVSVEESNRNAVHDLGTIVHAAHAAGLLVYQTCQPIGHVQPRTQARQDAYALHVAECAAIADAVERDNETNGYGSNETPDPKACATSMLACIEARDAHAPGRQLVTDSLCPASGKLGSTYVEPLTFLQAYVTAEPTVVHAAGLWFGWHGYCDFRYLANKAPFTWDTCWRARAAATFLRSRGVEPTIASSEFGAATGPVGFAQAVSPAQQAADFDGYMAEARSQTRDHAVKHGPWIWYCLRNRSPQNRDDWPAYAGLLDVHGAPMPVAARFSAAAKLSA